MGIFQGTEEWIMIVIEVWYNMYSNHIKMTAIKIKVVTNHLILINIL